MKSYHEKKPENPMKSHENSLVQISYRKVMCWRVTISDRLIHRQKRKDEKKKQKDEKKADKQADI